MKAEGQERKKQEEKGVNLVEEEWEPNHLFMASSSAEEVSSSVWLVDSGCSNHMTGERGLFTKLDES